MSSEIAERRALGYRWRTLERLKYKATPELQNLVAFQNVNLISLRIMVGGMPHICHLAANWPLYKIMM